MKILLTGGMGFIGSNFVHYWLVNHPKDDLVNYDKLTYAANPESLKDVEKNPHYKFIKGDICDRKLLEKVFEEEKPDIVVAMAAESHVDRSTLNPNAFLQTNIFGTYTLLEVARKYQPSLFIQIGTDEEYGSIREGSFFEGDPLNPASPYSSSKAAASLLALSYYKTYGVPVIVTRSSNNFGPYQFPEKFIPRLLTNAILGKNLPVYGKGQNIRDWLYVEDNCRGYDLVIHKGKLGEIYNIGGGNEKTNLEITKRIQERFPKSKIEFVADRPGHDFRYSLNCSKLEKLGFKPKYSFREALEKTIDWYLENQWWEPLKEKSEALYKDWGK